MADYSTYDKAELLKIIAKQEKELKTKKYGLVWDSEREPEQVVLDCENNLPILKRVESKEIRTDNSEDNILIEGDNYHALTVLNYTHKEKIDVIYIDPPYNTGNKSWKYNNRYVEKDDGYWHSKWLNMMEKRLNSAKRLLKKDGCLICAIDENEHANLGLLLNKIFPEYKIDCITIIHNPGGIQGDNFSYTHEYAYFVYPNKKRMIELENRDDDPDIRPLRNVSKGDHLRINAKNCFFPVYVKDNDIIGFGDVCDDDFHPESVNVERTDGVLEVYPIDPSGNERKWVFARQNVESIKDELRVDYNKKRKIFDIIRTKTRFNYKTVWTYKKYNANIYGTKLLNEIINTPFPFPKSLYNVKECILAVAKSKKNAIILDFFAGSGTTAHAVLELNKEDDGNRKFILCTNNENNICTDVTYPRVHNVIKGYKFKGKDKTTLFEKMLTWTDFNKKSNEIVGEINDLIEQNKNKYDKIQKEFKNNTIKIIGIKNIDGIKDGLNSNLQYFKTDLIKKTKNRDQVKINLTKKCTEMLCVKENIYNLEAEEIDYKIFSSNKKDKSLCIYYNLIDDTFNDFLSELKKLNGKKIIYMFSMENKVEKSFFVGIKNLKIEAIPQNILDVYKQLVKMNIPVKTNVIFTDLNKAKIKVFTDKDKDDGARVLRVVLEKVIQKISQDNSINILNAKSKEEKASSLNDKLYNQNIITKIEWAENRTCLAIGSNAAHGDYDDYDLKQVEKFYKHIQSLLNSYDV